jgi:hypothetical protein
MSIHYLSRGGCSEPGRATSDRVKVDCSACVNGMAAVDSRTITETTRIPERGSMTIDVVPAAPCALHGCSAELLVNQGPYSFVRVHLDDGQRRALIEALGGTWPA